MLLTERAQAAIITAHIRATISYTRNMATGLTPAEALSWARAAALTVEPITVDGAELIATTVAEEYDRYARPTR